MCASQTASSIRLGMVAWNALPAIMPALGMRVGGLETGAWTLGRAVATKTRLAPLFCIRAAMENIPDCVDEVAIRVKREPLREIRRQVSQHLELSWPPRVKSFHANLFWQVPLLFGARPWRPRPIAPCAPDPWLAKQSVDAWAAFGVNSDSAHVAATAAVQGKPLVLFLESNADLDPRILDPEEHVNAYGETNREQRFAISTATKIVCQSEFQLRQLKQTFGRDGVLIRNPIDRDEWKVASDRQQQHVLWIGRFDTFHKRPHLAIEIAKHCPELQFRMIINEGDPDVEAQIRGTAPDNVTIVDYVPFDQMRAEFSNALVFLCTGSAAHEGFPNVLLQAAATRTPILSLEDFDGFIASTECGVVRNQDPEYAAEELRRLVAQPSIRWTNVETYLETHHSMATVARKTEEIVLELVAGGPQ